MSTEERVAAVNASLGRLHAELQALLAQPMTVNVALRYFELREVWAGACLVLREYEDGLARWN